MSTESVDEYVRTHGNNICFYDVKFRERTFYDAYLKSSEKRDGKPLLSPTQNRSNNSFKYDKLQKHGK